MEVIQNRDHWVLHRLQGFYSIPENFNKVQTILAGDSRISLRLLDWLVTNYAKKHNVSYLATGNRHVVVYLAYKSHLKAYSKKMFDPFCRWKRIQFMEMKTTVGQLSFFEWAIQDDVLAYIDAHFAEIQKDMDDCSTVLTKTDGQTKRHELSRSATKTICRHDVRVSVSFA